MSYELTPERIHKVEGQRLNFDAVREKINAPEDERKRAELIYKVLNKAFDLLNYTDELPYVLLSKSGLLNDKHQVSALLRIQAGNVPVIFMYTGRDFIELTHIYHGTGRIAKLLRPILFMGSGIDRSAKGQLRAVVEAALEEAHHFVYRDKIPDKLLAQGTAQYKQQPHEESAGAFVAAHADSVAAEFAEYEQYYQSVERN